MSHLAVLLTLMSVVSIACHSVTRKWLFNRNALSETESLIIQCGIGTLLCGIWFLSYSDWENLALGRSNTTIYILAIAVTTLANIGFQFTNAKASWLADVSFTAPLMAMTPGLVVITGVLFGELPSTAGYIGISLIVVGAYIHAREGATLKEYLQPLFFWTIFANIDHLPEEERGKRRALKFAYCTALFGTVGLLADGLVARHGNMALGVTIELFGLTVAFILLYYLKQGLRVFDTSLRERLKKYWRQISLLGISFGLPFILLGIAFRLAPIAYVGSLKRLSIPLALIFAVLVLGEKTNSKRRFFTACIITCGALILAFDPTPAVLVNNLESYLMDVMKR